MTAFALTAGWLVKSGEYPSEATGRGVGAVLYDADGLLIGHHRRPASESVTTLTVLHLDAVALAAELAVENAIKHLEIRTDARWVVGQLEGAADEIKNEATRDALERTGALTSQLEVTYRVVPNGDLAPARDLAVAAAYDLLDTPHPPAFVGSVETRQTAPTAEARVTLRDRIRRTGALAHSLRLTGSPADAVETLLDIARDDVVAIWGSGWSAQWIADKISKYPGEWETGQSPGPVLAA